MKAEKEPIPYLPLAATAILALALGFAAAVVEDAAAGSWQSQDGPKAVIDIVPYSPASKAAR